MKKHTTLDHALLDVEEKERRVSDLIAAQRREEAMRQANENTIIPLPANYRYLSASIRSNQLSPSEHDKIRHEQALRILFIFLSLLGTISLLYWALQVFFK